MKLSIYGKSCKKCDPHTANAQEAAEALDLPVEIVKVTDMNAIIDKVVMRTAVLGRWRGGILGQGGQSPGTQDDS